MTTKRTKRPKTTDAAWLAEAEDTIVVLLASLRRKGDANELDPLEMIAALKGLAEATTTARALLPREPKADR